MMIHVTGQDIRKQLSGSYGMGLFCALLGLAILGFGAWFCGTNMGWSNLLAVILLILCGGCVLLALWMILKMTSAGSHRVFKKYGSPEFIAEYINSGAQNPLYLSSSVQPNLPFGLLITEKFIVSALEYADYLELKDIRTVTPTFIPDRQVRYIGVTPGAMLDAAIVNAANDRIRARQVQPGDRFDYLVIRDADNVRHQYAVRRSDMEEVINILLHYSPQMTILQPQSL